MQGSKYDEAVREQALGMMASGLSATKTAGILKIPRSTVCDWKNNAEESSEDFLAARRQECRKIAKKSWGVVADAVESLGKQIHDAKTEKTEIANVIRKVIATPFLDEDTAKQIIKIVRDYQGVTVSELTKTATNVYELFKDVDANLRGDADTSVQITFDGDLQDIAE